MGCIEAAVVSHVCREMPGSFIVDSGFCGHCISGAELPECGVDIQLFRDVRDLTPDIFDGIDAVVQFAVVVSPALEAGRLRPDLRRPGAEPASSLAMY